ncbi:MAG: LysR family transcriptional regulator [Bdellovibrionales bacterium]|nr:LysR family transcriptional regulator [Bdellovibrionales bacterium]
MDRLTAIQVFIEVAKTGSFTKAADNLDMSRPMVTRYMTALEEWAGVSLLQRTTRNVSVTPGGEAYLEKCKQIQDIAFDIEVKSKASATQPRGAIRVAASVSFAQSQFKMLVTDFLKKYPEITIDMIVSDRPVNLIESHVDFAIRISNNLDPSIVSKQLGVCRSCLVASPEYMKEHGTIKKIEDLKKHKLVAHNHFKSHRLVLRKDGRTEELAFTSPFSSNETLLLLEAVTEGLGIVMLPRYLVQKQIQQKRLVQILPDWELPEIGLHIVFTNRKFIAPQVRLFIDYLTEKARSQSW